MHRNFQLSLLGTGQGKGFLFGQGVLQKYLDQHKTTQMPPGGADAVQRIQRWIDSVQATSASETILEQKFIREIFCEVLGYALYPPKPGESATIFPKPTTRFTGVSGTPDAALGEFATENTFTVAVELKTPGADLDEPQPHHDYLSPVGQGFWYGSRILGIRWVLVSDMRLIRLYSIDSADEYEEIDLTRCTDDAAIRRLVFLLHHEFLVKEQANSQVSLLYGKSTDRQIQIRESFYDAYYWVRAVLFDAIHKASSSLTPQPSHNELLESTQRLLDRLLFVYYCEDHPQQLISRKTIEEITAGARRLPGASTHRVYDSLKALFREIDTGSPPASGLRLAAYNGELFKPHRIIDSIDLPDSLHDRTFSIHGPEGERLVRGVWGLHVYDFWSELNEYLLGHIFEESLSDVLDLGQETKTFLADKLQERKAGGIFFTSSILADFLCGSVVTATLDDLAPLSGESPAELVSAIERRLAQLVSFQAVDFACGSGAFLTALYRELLQEFWRLQTSLGVLRQKSSGGPPVDLLSAASVVEEARKLPYCVFGIDKLPQAVEIAKLAIWLRSARKDEKVLDLSSNVLAADSLLMPEVFTRLNRLERSFDVVVGNPPWGGVVDPPTYRQAKDYLALSDDEPWDSWELFLLLAIRALGDGGRLALVLPDSFMYPQKARLRQLVFESMQVEKLYNLGPDWFGPQVRMGTIVLQAKRRVPVRGRTMRSMLLAGALRQQAIRGATPLTQLESQGSRSIPVDRILESRTYECEVFRGVEDDEIIARMTAASLPLSGVDGLCERARGEEINKAGLLWICPSCLSPTTPGAKRKGGRYSPKKCERCGHELNESNVDCDNLVVDVRPSGDATRFVDGDDINRRYRRVRTAKWLRLGVSGWEYKDASIYASPKILLRQAGVGVSATIDETESRCPQSVYIYRLKPEEVSKGYCHEYVLAALLSRTMAYLVFKRFGEVDPAKAHAKLTHERLESLPIPRIDFGNREQRNSHDAIVEQATALLEGRARLGEEEDREIEQLLRSLWGLTPEDGAYINGQFASLPESQALTDLFPAGRPKPIARVEAE